MFWENFADLIIEQERRIFICSLHKPGTWMCPLAKRMALIKEDKVCKEDKNGSQDFHERGVLERTKEFAFNSLRDGTIAGQTKLRLPH